LAFVGFSDQGRSGSVDAEGYRTYTRRFLVEMDSVNDGPRTVSAGMGIALYSQYYVTSTEQDVYARCKTQDAELVAGEKFLWTYVVVYDTRPFFLSISGTSTLEPDATTGGAPPTPPAEQSPPDRPWALSWGSVDNVVVLNDDFSIPSKPVQASNGEALEGIETESGYTTFTLTAYSVAARYPSISLFKHTTNSATFLGFAAEKLRCIDYRIESMYEQGGFFYKREISFAIAPFGETWNVKVLDKGHYERIHYAGSAFADIKPVDKIGAIMNEPFLLDGVGRRLSVGADPVYLSFKPYKIANWSNIILGNP
jgi:hypothetical protein